MSYPSKNPLEKQPSLSYIEQSLKIIPAPPQEPVIIYRGPNAANSNLSKADIEISNRLEKLRKRDADIPTEEEMANRLAQLKGLPANHYSKPSIVYKPPDNRTQVEKTDDLLKQVIQEVSINTEYAEKDTDDIEMRLAQLRGTAPQAQSTKPSSSSPFTFTQTTACKETAHSSEIYDDKFVNFDEIEQIMKEAEKEVNNATTSVKSLNTDPEIRKVLKESKKSSLKKRTDSTSSEERDSSAKNSSSGDEGKPKARENPLSSSSKEREEVERIVQLYSKKVEEKKRKKKLLKKGSGHVSSSSSSGSELVSSDLEISASSSEKLSTSDSD